MSTMPLAYETTTDLNSDLLRQLIHFAAVFCRFTLPFGFMIGGLVAYRKIQQGRKSLSSAKAKASPNFRDR